MFFFFMPFSAFLFNIKHIFVCNKIGKRPQRTPSTGRVRSASGHTTTEIHGGGLSVTGCLADFSLYIFHPYGGGQKKTSLAALESSFRRGMGKYILETITLRQVKDITILHLLTTYEC